jgi:hypothetical protein
MKKSITDINLTQPLTARDRERKNQLDYRRLDDGAESLTIVNPMMLGKATGDETSLVLINGPIWPMLGLEDPLAAHNVNT